MESGRTAAPGSLHPQLAARRDSKVATPYTGREIWSHDLIVVDASGKLKNSRSISHFIRTSLRCATVRSRLLIRDEKYGATTLLSWMPMESGRTAAPVSLHAHFAARRDSKVATPYSERGDSKVAAPYAGRRQVTRQPPWAGFSMWISAPMTRARYSMRWRPMPEVSAGFSKPAPSSVTVKV
jgi:hypothetical protein